MNNTKSKVRNKLEMDKCEKLVYVQMNLRLLPENQPLFFTSSTSSAVQFSGGGDSDDDENEELKEPIPWPDAWRSARVAAAGNDDDDDNDNDDNDNDNDDIEPQRVRDAANNRSKKRAEVMRANPAPAVPAPAAPAPAAATAATVRTSSGRVVKRAHNLQDFV